MGTIDDIYQRRLRSRRTCQVQEKVGLFPDDSLFVVIVFLFTCMF